MFQSDVFALGLVLYQLFSGQLPEWPFKWPPPGYSRIRGKLRPKMLTWLRKSMEFKPHDRYKNAVTMERAFNKIHLKLVRRDR
jgi:serine/threonine-protein kinase